MDNIISSNKNSAEDRMEKGCAKKDSSFFDRLVYMGMDAGVAKKFLLDHVKQVVRNGREGSLEEEVEICLDVLKDLGSDQAAKLVVGAMDPGKNHSEDGILALVRALPKLEGSTLKKRWEKLWKFCLRSDCSLYFVHEFLETGIEWKNSRQVMLSLFVGDRYEVPDDDVHVSEMGIMFHETNEIVKDKFRLVISKAENISFDLYYYPHLYYTGTYWSLSFLVEMFSFSLNPHTSAVKKMSFEYPWEILAGNPPTLDNFANDQDVRNALSDAALGGNAAASASKIEELAVGFPLESDDTHEGLVAHLIVDWMPNLKRLELQGIVHCPMSAVATIVSNGKLETLLVLPLDSHGEECKAELVLNALENGTGPFALKTLQIDDQHDEDPDLELITYAKQLIRILQTNAVLENLYIGITAIERREGGMFNPLYTFCDVFEAEEENDHGEMIHHGSIVRLYLALNRCGRGKILPVREGSTLEDLVNSLVKAHSDDWVSGNDYKCIDEGDHYHLLEQGVPEEAMACRKTSIIFDLLLLNSSLLVQACKSASGYYW